MKSQARKNIVTFLLANPGSTEAAIMAAMTPDTVIPASTILKKMVKSGKVIKVDDSYTASTNINDPNHVTP